ncbi:MAG: pilus assembly protein [Dechloromonas sp.]|nr:MAG: pilus assembly protein [Dechloromonas sp.]
MEHYRPLVQIALIALLMPGAPSSGVAALPIPDTPLIATQVAKPMTMLVASKDHKLFYEAYNDASDVDGDGTLDVRFKPSITYYGLFDSSLCYAHNNKSDNTGLFTPADTTSDGKCKTKTGRWSGNFLNYVTTSRIDALRKVLYGGYREVDTASQTVLRRAYIPQDAHSWGKEYTSLAVDGYLISDYTPLDAPTAGNRHLFGNLTINKSTDCSTLNTCSNLPPILATVTNTSKRIWEWASTERPVLDGTPSGGARTNRTVRVEVCTSSFNGGCKQYPNGNYKPVGLLHDYGETESMLFGLLTGSYDKNQSGGILRKVVSSFKNEVNTTDGVFTSDARIVSAFNSLRIRDYNNTRTDQAYKGGWVTTRPMNEKEFVDWGNPVAEMMYEALRYFAGKGSATPAYTFTATGSIDDHVGLPFATWDDPYNTSTGSAKAPWCAKPNLLTISDINPSFDSDQVPGSAFGGFSSSSLDSLNVTSLADGITDTEPTVKGSHFIGQNCTLASCYDGAPTPKNVVSLSTIRGLAPEEPTKQGSYYSAAVAYYGKTGDLRTDKTGSQNTDTYVVALASPLPRIEVKVSSGLTITLVPFAKSVDGSSIDRTKGKFQPTDQIVDFYVDTIANSGTADANPAINSGRYYAKFRINFEDVEQGADHDMDAISEYEIWEQVDGKLRVKVTPTYQAGGIRQNMGYIISGTTKDGVYLVAQDENADTAYYLNTPPGRDPGYCDVATMPADCKKLPYLGAPAGSNYSDRTFTAGGSAATLLKDPLWFASKWGGFVDRNGNQKPDLALEWDADGNGTPDTYFLVQNPLKLKESLKQSFDTIISRSASAGNITSNGQQISTDSKIFQSVFNSATWDGELKAFPVGAGGVSATPAWLASEKLPAHGLRKIFTWKDSTTKGIAFNWSDLTADQQVALGNNSQVVNYLRGDTSLEIQNGGSFRNRTKLLGDIVHSSPYYVKDTNTVYVGANDGMLHAFDATTGVEQFAYVPSSAYTNLLDLSSAFYSHKFFVDGDIAVSTSAQTPSKNYMIASAGRGGKILFGLDVTNPSGFLASNVLWEYSDTYPATDNDLGYIIGRPQIAKLNNGVVAAIVPNGYNSSSGSAVLYIFNLETGALIKKIDTGATGDNGLAIPGLWDVNNDGKIDYVYAGDLKGNVWKFDLTNDDPVLWGLSSVTPLFIARDGSSNRQPITAQITVAINDLKDDPNITKTFLFFGTGSYMSSTDPGNKSQQTWYGIIDNGSPIASRTELRERTISITGTVYDTAGNPIPVRSFSEGEISPHDMLGMMGWFTDLKDPTARGERIVTSSRIVKATLPTLIASSIIPDEDPCMPGGTGYINFVNAFTGARLTTIFFDVNGDGRFDSNDSIDGVYSASSMSVSSGMPGEGTIVGDRFVVGDSKGEIKDPKFDPGFKKTGRISWREIRQQ